MSFKSDIEKFRAKALKAADMVFRGTCLEIFGKIIMRTPVLTGRLIGNWQCELNSYPTDQIDRKGAAASSAAMGGTVARSKVTDSAFFVNNLPYAQRIENGYSAKSPAGMVKVTIAEFNAVVERNARQS